MLSSFIFGCQSFTGQEVNHLKNSKPLMNYLRHWLKGYGYSLVSINEGLSFGQSELNKFKDISQQFKGLPFFKKKFLIMTSQNFERGKKGNCLISLGLLKKEFQKGETQFSVDLNCEKPFKSLAREISHDKSPVIYSIGLRPIANFEAQRSFRFFVETKRWRIAMKFLKKGADPLIYINKYKNVGTTPLNIAFGDFWNFYKRMHSVQFINELLKKEGVVNFKEASGKTSLKKYLLKDNKLIVKKLIQVGAVLNIQNKAKKNEYLDSFKGNIMEKNNLIEKFYNKLKNISKFPSSVSLKQSNRPRKE